MSHQCNKMMSLFGDVLPSLSRTVHSGDKDKAIVSRDIIGCPLQGQRGQHSQALRGACAQGPVQSLITFLNCSQNRRLLTSVTSSS